ARGLGRPRGRAGGGGGNGDTAFLPRGRRVGGGARGLRHERKRSAVAHAVVAAVRGAARVQGGGRQQRLLRQFRRLDHRRVVLAPVRRGGPGGGALRHLRLEPDQQAPAAGGR